MTRIFTAAVMLFALASGAQVAAAAERSAPPVVDVRESRGIYSVTARFQVPQPPAGVLAVLTDYEQIPRYMPDVRTSIVHERAPGRALVEQEALSRTMMFSKRVHLLLDVREEGNVIRFRDTCGQSFIEYHGRWVVSQSEGSSTVAYELHARPSFSVPEFLLKRLLRRDAIQMIERMQREIAARAAQ